ncbi:MAG: ribonuclease E, partial [Rhodospirillaceae bacterium]
NKAPPRNRDDTGTLVDSVDGAENVENVDADDNGDVDETPPHPRLMRGYKIQEVIKRRQIMLVQVVKEERGNKGAAMTTYLSLAGRYCVLMPNATRGGGVSRKITSLADRKRLKALLTEFNMPRGVAVILRTAGAERVKSEIRRDYEYLARTWNQIREATLQSQSPALVYEEANLIKRAIRDLYTRDIDEIIVAGEEGYRLAKDFMKTLTPSHAKRVQKDKNEDAPLFHRYKVAGQIDAMHSPTVQLRSGGYVVFNQTEALVAIDVNSGKATRERHIEETALKTNLEAAEEIARQLRLRDLAGLIVIDFIDMEESRNNATVEKRLKEALKGDRARIQVGCISPFGLLELSRQRLRPSLMETSFQPCPHCHGTGLLRSVESSAMHMLRGIEEEGLRRRSLSITVTCPAAVAFYVLNHKRQALANVERRYSFQVLVLGDASLTPPTYRMERVMAGREEGEGEGETTLGSTQEVAHDRAMQPADGETMDSTDDEETDETKDMIPESVEEGVDSASGSNVAESTRRRRHRRRRRGGQRGNGDLGNGEIEATVPDGTEENAEEDDNTEEDDAEGEGTLPDEEVREGDSGFHGEASGESGTRRRRRGRRGGRRRRREEGDWTQNTPVILSASARQESKEMVAPDRAEIVPVEETLPAFLQTTGTSCATPSDHNGSHSMDKAGVADVPFRVPLTVPLSPGVSPTNDALAVCDTQNDGGAGTATDSSTEQTDRTNQTNQTGQIHQAGLAEQEKTFDSESINGGMSQLPVVEHAILPTRRTGWWTR